MAFEESLTAFKDVVKYIVITYYDVPDVMVANALLDAPRLTKPGGEVFLALQHDQDISKRVSLEPAKTRRALYRLLAVGIATRFDKKKAKDHTLFKGSSSRSQVVEYEDVSAFWGVDFDSAVDVLMFKMHFMKIKVEELVKPAQIVYVCAVCNLEVKDTDIDRAIDMKTGQLLCPSRNLKCVGQELKEVHKGPSADATQSYKKALFDNIKDVTKLISATKGYQSPLYCFKSARQLSSASSAASSRNTMGNQDEARPKAQCLPPWFLSADDKAKRKSEEENTDEVPVVCDTTNECAQGDELYTDKRNMMDYGCDRTEGVAGPVNDNHDDDQEDGEEYDDYVFTVKGIPKMLSQITSEDQDDMTDEEYSNFCAAHQVHHAWMWS